MPDQLINKRRFRFVHISWVILFLSFHSALVKTDAFSITLGFGNFLRIGTVSLSCIIALICIMRRQDGITYLFRSSFPLLMIYAIISIISGSYASHPFYSIWKSIEVIVNILVAVAVLAENDQSRSVRTLYGVSIVSYYLLLLSVWMGALFDPNSAFHYARGILNIQLYGVLPTINPNTVGFLGAFISFASFVRFIRTQWSIKRLLYLTLFAVHFLH